MPSASLTRADEAVMSSPSCGSALFVVGNPTGTSLTLSTAVVGAEFTCSG